MSTPLSSSDTFCLNNRASSNSHDAGRSIATAVLTDVLVTSHLRLAAKVARRYQRYGLPLADLIGEANLGSRHRGLAF